VLETSARLLRLLSLLQTPREWTGKELAGRLEVSTRTIRNDVERLRSLGYPVHATRGSIGGYRLGAGAALPPLLLDDEEAVAVAVGLGSGANGSVEGIEESSLRALAKLEQVLPPRLRYRLAALQAYTVAVPARRAGARIPTDLLTTVVAACRDRERLRFDYQAHDGTQSRRDTEPYRVVNFARRWYLVAFDTQRQDWRTFRVDRMRPVTPTGPRFAARPLPAEDIAGYVAHKVGAVVKQYTATVVVHAPAAVVTERLPPSVGSIEARDAQSCVLRTGSDNPEMLAVWLGALGYDFEVTGAPEITAHLEVLAARYARAATART
jgi:predicted DNA-binding transcriptional regulator YafY